MLDFTRKQNSVIVTIDTGLGITVETTSERGKDLDAVLLMQHLNMRMYDKLKSIRKEAYLQGWKDKSSKKKPKQDWFSGNW